MACLAYLAGFISGIIVLASKPHGTKPYVRFHAYQSIFLSVVLLGLYGVVSLVAVLILAATADVPGAVDWALLLLAVVLKGGVGLAELALWIVLMVKAYNGKRPRLPIIGKISERLAEKGAASKD